MVFVLLRFYVKSILRVLEVPNKSFKTHLEAQNLDFDEFLHFLKVEIYQMNKIHNP